MNLLKSISYELNCLQSKSFFSSWAFLCYKFPHPNFSTPVFMFFLSNLILTSSKLLDGKGLKISNRIEAFKLSLYRPTSSFQSSYLSSFPFHRRLHFKEEYFPYCIIFGYKPFSVTKLAVSRSCFLLGLFILIHPLCTIPTQGTFILVSDNININAPFRQHHQGQPDPTRWPHTLFDLWHMCKFVY